MNNPGPFQSNEANLFEFHFTSAPAYDTNQPTEKFQPSIFQQPQQPYYSYYSDSTPTNHQSDPNPMFSSPQLKPANSLPHQRKRFKTLVPSKHAPLLSPNSEKDKAESENAKDDDDEDDFDGETGSDTDSNQDGDANNKRGKYKIYTEQEKSTIINFMMKHGMQKTLEIFSGNTHKITKRKLKSWLDGQFKVKGVKGRKTNDPNRDQALYDWCLVFQQDYGRAPTRKEATKKALEISEDPTFQASKGWLDKFSRKFNLEFTPLKIIPVKNRKKVDGFLLDNDSLSSASGSDTSVEGISPLIQGMQTMQVAQPNQQAEQKPWGFESHTTPTNSNEYSNFGPSGQVSSYFSNQQHNNYGGMNGENKNMTAPSFEQNYYHQPPSNNNYYNHHHNNHNHNHNNNHYPMNFQTQQPYQMNPEGNFQLDYIYLPNNQNQNQNQNQNHAPDVTNFFNPGSNYGAGYIDDHMKMEHPY